MQRILVMDVAGKDAEPEPQVLINPEITWSSEQTGEYEEGCLSIPEIYEKVTRPAEVRVAYTDIDGKAQEQDFGELAATCVQHEIDHLNGKLFIDYLSALKRTMITSKMKKLKRDRTRS
jgi:peptide deformylase